MTKKKKTKSGKKANGGQRKTDKVDIVLSAIHQLGAKASLRHLFPVLLKKLTQEEIVLALNELDHQQVISIGPKGQVKLLLAQAEQQEYAPSEAAEPTKTVFKNTVIGTVDLTQSGAAYVAVDGFSKDVYIPQRQVRNAMQGDEVRVRITQAGRRPEGEIVAILKRSRDTFTGRLDVTERFAFFIADDVKMKNDVYVPLDLLKGAKHHDKVIARVTDWGTGSKNPAGEVLEVLKNDFSTDLDMKRILIESGFSIEFPREVYRELENVGDNIAPRDLKSRLDFRQVTTFTIDPVDAKDFDDALSVRQLESGNWEIGIHIADVGHYVQEGSALDKEAERRATSVYLPDRVCPMLPERLSNVLCSLRPKEDKLTFSCIVEFDAANNMKGFSIAKTVIHSNRRFTYEEAQEVLESGKGEFAAELKKLHEISKKMRSARFAKGAIAFEKAEVRFKLDENAKPVGIVLKERKDAHLLVEDFMLLANETVARYCSKLRTGKQAVPFVYRIHDKPDKAKLQQFSAIAARFGYRLNFEDGRQIAETLNTLLKKVEGKPEQNVLETMAIRTMAKAAYTTANIGHYGLAMEHYTHFTSPIRRYPDVLVHRLLYEILSGSDRIIDKEELETRCKHSSLMERKAMEAERDATKYKQIEYLSDHVGEEFDGVISGVIGRGFFVELSENKCEGMVSLEALGSEDFMYDETMLRLTGIKSRKSFQIGDKIRVKVINADILLRRIDLMPA